MSYQEDLNKLRKRIIDAVEQEVLDPKLREFYEATMIQIMNESERQRQTCVQQAETLRRQAATLDGQASAFAMQSSIVYNVLNSFVLMAEKQIAEEKIREAQKKQSEDDMTDQEKENIKKLIEEQEKSTFISVQDLSQTIDKKRNKK